MGIAAVDNSWKPLNIALDYDETFTEDRVFWRSFIILTSAHRHQVTFVTYRTNDPLDDNSDIELDAKTCGIEIVYSCGKPKRMVFDLSLIHI